MTSRQTLDPPDHPARNVPYPVARGQLRLASTLGATERAQFVRRFTTLAPKPQERLAGDPDQNVLRALVEHKHLLPSVQRTLAGRASGAALDMLARHPHLDPEVAKLLHRRGGSVLVALAQNSATPSDLLDRLLRSQLSAAAAAAQRNPNTRAAVAALLAALDQRRALPIVAANWHAGDDTLRELVRSTRNDVLSALAGNPALPPDVLDELVDHPQAPLVTLATNPSLTPHSVQVLKQQKDVAVLMRLAANPATPEEVLLELDEGDGAPQQVQNALAKNPNTPREILERYLERGGKSLVLRVLHNSAYDHGMLRVTPVKALHSQQLEVHCVTSSHWETIRTLAQNWRGTVGDLLDTAEALA